MSPRRTGHQRQICPVVDDDRDLVGVRSSNDLITKLEEHPGCQTLGPNLNEWRSAVEKRPCQIRQRPTSGRCVVGVENCVE